MNDGFDWTRTVFVAMPFGKKKVGDVDVDFNDVYQRVLKPGIELARTPSGDAIVATRADEGFFAGDIDVIMYRRLELARLCVFDLTGDNVNVFYELGVRHRARPSGTVMLRQISKAVAFDISHTRVFTYDPADTAAGRALIASVVSETLKVAPIDSPVRVAIAAGALDAGAPGAGITGLMREAEQALAVNDERRAFDLFERVLDRVGDADVHLRAAVLAVKLQLWDRAIAHADAAIVLQPGNATAYAQRGIALNKRKDVQAGEASLRKAVELDPQDYDAWASLGGALRTAGKLEDALGAYQQAARISKGHPYPLLNVFKLKLQLDQQPSALDLLWLEGAEDVRRPQAAANPPYDAPWCFFDLADIAYFLGRADECAKLLRKGAAGAQPWQWRSHRDSIAPLAAKTADPTLLAAVRFLDELIDAVGEH